MQKQPVYQSELQCENCAGQCHFSISNQSLECQSCGHLRDLKTSEDHLASAEFPIETAEGITETILRDQPLTHQCNTCAGAVVFTGTALSEHCPYCDGPVVLGQADSAYQTMALIPFKTSKDQALYNAIEWMNRRIALPKELKPEVLKARIAGLYAPFWTFDSDEAVQYWARYTKGHGDNRRTVSTSGKLKIQFDDLLMPASPHVTPLIRDGILHDFHPSALRPYRAGYLAGFAAENHHQSVDEGITANADDKSLLIRNHIKQHINKSGVHNIRYHTDTSGIHYRRILLPVWILHYSHKQRPYKIVVSAIDGRTFGERPFSYVKLALYSAFMSALLIAFGILWGAAGLL